MEWRKQQAGAAAGFATPSPTNGTSAPSRTANPASDVDDIEMFGSVGGGVLTRQAFEDCQKMINPVGLAEARLQAIVESAGTMPASAAASMLKLEMNGAIVAGVREGAPQMRKARQLLGIIEMAAASEAARGEPDAERDALASKMDLLFSQEFDADFPDEL